MIKQEIEAVDRICDEIRKTRKLSEGQRARLYRTLGSRLDSALKALEEGVVKRYVFEPSGRVVWIAVGREKDYQILPEVNYCSCDDYYYRVVDGEAALCYHIIAQKLAEALSRYEEIRDSDELWGALMGEWRFIKREEFKTPPTP